MDPARRRSYLKALGIEHYVRRDAPSAAPAERVVATAATAVAAEAAVPRPIEPMPPRAKIPATLPLPVAPAAPPVITAATPVDVPRDWVGLRDRVRDCQHCKLCATRTQTVFGVGVEDAPLLVVGEGPGADEDAQGEPFVGRAGKLLDQMLLSIGRSRSKNTYIANVVKCRPPGNRDPEADEVEACRPYLDRQIELIKPKLIVASAVPRRSACCTPMSRCRSCAGRCSNTGRRARRCSSPTTRPICCAVRAKKPRAGRISSGFISCCSSTTPDDGRR